MELIGLLSMLIGMLIGLVFGIQFLIVAFRESILWGLGCIFVPFVSLIFLATNWDVAKTPFLRWLLAIPFYIVGMLLLSSGA